MKFIYYSSKQTAKEIKEEGLKLKRYYKVLLLLFTFILISSGVHAKGVPFFHFNESLCTCTAGSSSSAFNYGDYFNQELNTSSQVRFSEININPQGETNYGYPQLTIENTWGDPAKTYKTLLYDSVLDLSIDSTYDETYRNELLIYSGEYYGEDPHSWYFNVMNNTRHDQYLIILNGESSKVTLPTLNGSGSAFACLNENGTLYRSATACN